MSHADGRQGLLGRVYTRIWLWSKGGIDKHPGVVYDFYIACNSILKGPMIDQAVSDVMGTTLVLIFKLFSRNSGF